MPVNGFIEKGGSLGLGVVGATRRKFFTTDYTDFFALIRAIRG